MFGFSERIDLPPYPTHLPSEFSWSRTEERKPNDVTSKTLEDGTQLFEFPFEGYAKAEVTVTLDENARELTVHGSRNADGLHTSKTKTLRFNRDVLAEQITVKLQEEKIFVTFLCPKKPVNKGKITIPLT